MAMTGYYRTMQRPRAHQPLSMLKYDPIGTTPSFLPPFFLDRRLPHTRSHARSDVILGQLNDPRVFAGQAGCRNMADSGQCGSKYFSSKRNAARNRTNSSPRNERAQWRALDDHDEYWIWAVVEVRMNRGKPRTTGGSPGSKDYHLEPATGMKQAPCLHAYVLYSQHGLALYQSRHEQHVCHTTNNFSLSPTPTFLTLSPRLRGNTYLCSQVLPYS